MDLTNDPSLNKGDVLACRNLDWKLVVVEPCIGVTTASN